MQGQVQWERQFGRMAIKMGFGEGSSPALHGDTVVVNWDHEGESFITALDKRTGEERWRVPRDEATSWSTPLVVEVAGNPQVIVSATGKVRGYDLASGDLIWQCGGMTGNVIPCPVASDGIVYVTSGFRGNALLAIRLSQAGGDITGTGAVLWQRDRDTPYAPSPLLYGDALYLIRVNDPFLSCFDARTGEPRYTGRRLEGITDFCISNATFTAKKGGVLSGGCNCVAWTVSPAARPDSPAGLRSVG
jgi:outer membrane protein assembly factor BamB